MPGLTVAASIVGTVIGLLNAVDALADLRDLARGIRYLRPAG